MLLSDFLQQHSACADGARWAKRLGSQDMATLFAKLRDRKRPLAAQQAEWVVWGMTREGVLGHKDLVRFAVFCAKQAEAQMPQASKDALAVVERWLAGKATQDELAAADTAAHAAYASAAAYTAAADAAALAALAAAATAAYAAAYTAARRAQAAYLLNLRCPFGRKTARKSR